MKWESWSSKRCPDEPTESQYAPGLHKTGSHGRQWSQLDIWSTARFVRRKWSNIVIVLNRDPQRRATNPHSLSITQAVETVEGAATFRRMAVHLPHFIWPHCWRINTCRIENHSGNAKERVKLWLLTKDIGGICGLLDTIYFKLYVGLCSERMKPGASIEREYLTESVKLGLCLRNLEDSTY